MDRFRFALSLYSLIAFTALADEVLRAEGPGTLMKWSYGPNEEGGPDLDEPITTDRPDFTESSVTVGRNVVQIEMGYTYTYDGDGNTSNRSHSYPQTLLRVGTLADWFELRFDWNYNDELNRDFSGSASGATGADDLGIGCKIALTPQQCCLPETAIIIQSTVPTGSHDFTAHEMCPGVGYLYGWDVTDFFSTGGETQINRTADGETGEFYAEFAQSWTTGQSWTDRLASYAEWFCLVPCGADTDHTQHYFDGGFTFLITDNIQYDIEAGVGLNSAADDYFVGTGLSVRFK